MTLCYGFIAIEYTYESNRIEGNTLTLQETELVVNEGVTISGKSMREHLEAINHAEAIDYIKEFAHNEFDISERTIKEIHALILHGIDRDNAGKYRTVPVMISGSEHIPPQPYLIEKQMEDFILTYQRMKTEHTPGTGCRLSVRRISTYSSFYRRKRMYIPFTDEPAHAKKRIYTDNS